MDDEQEKKTMYEFPPAALPAVMQGPRVERRRILLGGSAFWGTIV